MKSFYKIAVLITCHNRKEKTLACLSSLFNVNPVKGYQIEVFLVDDGSTDGTGEAVEKHFPQVDIIQGNGNLYWNKGMHLAWDTASQKKEYDYYVWLNDDVELKPNAFEDLISNSKKKPDSIICGTVQSKHQEVPTYGGRDSDGNLIVPDGNPQSCSIINGNLVLVPQSVFKILGNLDVIFPHSIGDFDYGLRAKKEGIQCFTSAGYCGYCEINPTPPKWCLPEVPFSSRLKNLYSPLGRSHPYYYFLFEYRHYGVLVALRHFLSIHLRVVSPKLYMNLKKKDKKIPLVN